MNEKEIGAFAVAEMHNEKLYPSHEARAFMNDRTALHLRDLEYRHSLYEEMRPTREERDIKSRLHSSLLDKLGARDDYERLRQLERERLDANRILPRLFPLDRPGSVVHPHSDPAEDGIMVWWAKTSWFFPTTKATIWMDGDGVHIAAKFEIDDGDLHKYSIRVVAQFEVRADRMPPKGRNYLSNPVSEVSGQAYGFVGGGGLLDFGDTWSKCWLNTKQTVFTFAGFDESPEPPPPGTIGVQVVVGQVVGFTSDSHQLIFSETGNPDVGDLPGLMGLPVTFFLPATAVSLLIELEWQFDVQIEGGHALLWLGHTPAAQVCTIKHPQWTIRGV